MVDGGDGPGDADAEEDVNGVTAGHVADRVVRVFVLNGGDFRRKRVRNGSPESHERYGCHGVL